MRAVGQPYTRLGRTFGFCAKAKGHPRVNLASSSQKAARSSPCAAAAEVPRESVVEKARSACLETT